MRTLGWAVHVGTNERPKARTRATIERCVHHFFPEVLRFWSFRPSIMGNINSEYFGEIHESL